MTNITAVNGANIPVVPGGTADKALDQTAFLRLMTTQMNAQDPFNPMDNTQMVAQMAQFSSVAGIAEMNVALRTITHQIGEQTSLLADLVSRLDAPETASTAVN
jgi:flagellar basal-body rod modification protein FlgD